MYLAGVSMTTSCAFKKWHVFGQFHGLTGDLTDSC